MFPQATPQQESSQTRKQQQVDEQINFLLNTWDEDYLNGLSLDA